MHHGCTPSHKNGLLPLRSSSWTCNPPSRENRSRHLVYSHSSAQQTRQPTGACGIRGLKRTLRMGQSVAASAVQVSQLRPDAFQCCRTACWGCRPGEVPPRQSFGTRCLLGVACPEVCCRNSRALPAVDLPASKRYRAGDAFQVNAVGASERDDISVQFLLR